MLKPTNILKMIRINKVFVLFWIMIFCFNLSTVSLFLYSTWVNVHASPFMVTVDSYTYPIKDIEFPAISLCNFNRISRKALDHHVTEIQKLHKLDNETTERVHKYLLQFGRLIDYRYDDKVEVISEASPLNYSNMDIKEFMLKMAPSCEEMLIKCRWSGRIEKCIDIFKTRRTALGHCCTFNYVFDLNDSTQRPVKSQVTPGPTNGLVVVLNSMPKDYAYHIGNGHGFHVLIHDALYYPEFRGGRVQYHIAQSNYMQVLEIQSIKQYSTAEVHKYSSQTRKCTFRNEDQESYYGLYSLNACLVKCRIEAIKSLCSCIPYFYHIKDDKTETMCTLSHLKCLNKYSKKLLYLYPEGLKDVSGLETEIANSLHCPNCQMDCELTYTQSRQFKVSLSKMSRQGIGNNFLSDVNLTNQCVLAIYHPTSVGILHRLDVVAYWFEILSNIGGFSGMIMGIGWFTFVEISYYLIIRFPRTIYINVRNNH